MSFASRTNNKRASELFAEAKALRFATRNQTVNYREAKAKAEELLQEVNTIGERIAKKYGRKHRKIRFTDL